LGSDVFAEVTTMKRWRTAVALVALGVLGASPVLGQTLHHSFEVTGMGGIRVYDEDVVFMDSGYVFGGKLAWFPHANIGVEGTVSFSSADVAFAPELEALIEDFLRDADLEDRSVSLEGEGIDVFEIRFDAVYQFLFNTDQRWVPYFSAGVGQFVFDTDNPFIEADEPETTFNWGGGLKIFFNRNVALRLDARDNVAVMERPFGRPSLPPGPNTKTFQANNPEFQVGLTVGFGGSEETFGVRDSDFDGVPDKDDLCPNTPRGVIVDATGCPMDSDGDGVPDGIDSCPNTPAGAMVDERGCPLDSDNDGVFDGLDQCPNTPAGVQVDERGCPLEPEVEACLGSQDWYTGDATINVDGKGWVKFGAIRTAALDQLTQVGEYEGVSVYVGVDAERPYREIWLPLCTPANSYQPYRLESEVRGTTGFIQSLQN
jgi:hypothetical protein